MRHYKNVFFVDIIHLQSRKFYNFKFELQISKILKFGNMRVYQGQLSRNFGHMRVSQGQFRPFGQGTRAYFGNLQRLGSI